MTLTLTTDQHLYSTPGLTTNLTFTQTGTQVRTFTLTLTLTITITPTLPLPLTKVDGANNKWMDESALQADGALRSVLRLRLAAGSVVARYKLVSANDNPARDPSSWAFGLVSDP